MAVARIVMQNWKDDFDKLLKNSKIMEFSANYMLMMEGLYKENWKLEKDSLKRKDTFTIIKNIRKKTLKRELIEKNLQEGKF